MKYPLIVLFKEGTQKSKIEEKIRDFLDQIDAEDIGFYDIPLEVLKNDLNSSNPNKPIRLIESKNKLLEIICKQPSFGMDLININTGKQIDLFTNINKLGNITKPEMIKTGISNTVEELKNYLQSQNDKKTMLYALQLEF